MDNILHTGYPKWIVTKVKQCCSYVFRSGHFLQGFFGIKNPEC